MKLLILRVVLFELGDNTVTLSSSFSSIPLRYHVTEPGALKSQVRVTVVPRTGIWGVDWSCEIIGAEEEEKWWDKRENTRYNSLAYQSLD